MRVCSRKLILSAAIFLGGLFGADAAAAAPSITSLSTTTGVVGTTVTITGTGFGSTRGTSTVAFHGTTATPCSSCWSGTSIRVAVPTGATTGNVVVTVSGVPSNGIVFTITPLPSGWLDADIGSVGLAGSASYANGVFTVTGAGNGLYGTADSLNFAYQTLSGDGTIVARIVSSTGTDTYSGIMIRDTLNAGAANASVNYDYRGGPSSFIFFDRPTTGANSAYQSDFTQQVLPYWIKLVRSGSNFTPYESLDGVNWTQSKTGQTVTTGQNVLIGLGVTSRSSGTLATTTFDNVSISSTATPAPTITSTSATTGNVGAHVVLTGTGFGNSQAGSSVLLNGVATTINSWTATSINITIPTGATSGPLAVTVAPSMNTSNPVEFTITSNPLPSGWLDQDIGAVGVAGSTSYVNNVFTVAGAGKGIGQNSNITTTDGFRFVYQPLSGDGTLVARITGVTGTNAAQVGVMIRETLDAGSTTGYLWFRSPNIFLMYRPSTGANIIESSSTVSNASLPTWLKLERTGNFLRSFTSTDGENWTELGTPQAITLQPNVFIGLGVSSTGVGSLATATFDNVSISSATNPAPLITRLSATTGAAGSQVTITGSNFGNTKGNSQVYLNGTPTTLGSWSSTSITITIPAGAASGPLVVSVAPEMDDSNPVFFTVTSQALLLGWLDQDIGAVGAPGSAGYANGVFTVLGSGSAPSGGVDGAFDAFHFVYQPITTNATVIARVVTSGNNYAQAGVMIRETLDSNASEIFPYVTLIPPNGYSTVLHYRNGGNNITTRVAGAAVTLPYWFKAVRTANQFSAYTSSDGNVWTQIGVTQKITTAQTVYIGFGVSSTSYGPLATATFDHVSLTLGTALANPVISGISPTSGAPGITATVNGSGFGATQGTNPLSTVDFNGALATVSSWADGQIKVIVPGSASVGPVSVQVGNITSAGPLFTPQLIAQLTDSLGNQSTYTSQISGNKWNVINYQGSGCSTCSVRTNTMVQFDGSGNTLFSTDALGSMTSNNYDQYSNLLSTTSPIDSSNSANFSYTYNNFGEVLTATDPLYHVTTNTYDPAGNLLTVTAPSPDGSLPGSKTTFTYYPNGELKTITDPLSNVTTLTYFPTGMIQTVKDMQGNVTTYDYDLHGNRKLVQDAQLNKTQFQYDAGDRLKLITYPDTTTTQIAYDYRGRRYTVTDQNSKITTYGYDDADRLMTVTDASTPANVTTYGYDNESNLTSIKDASGNMTKFDYWPSGQVKLTTFPSTLTESYTYDANNNLKTKTDRKSQMITYTYDQLNRVSQKAYPDSSTVAYTYDTASRLTQVTDPTGTYTFTFDNMGRLFTTSVSYSFLARTLASNYTYDAASNRKTFVDAESGSTAYDYDTLNRLQDLTPPAAFGSGKFVFGYDILSRRNSLTRPNNVTTNYGYDTMSRLNSVLHQVGATTLDGVTYPLFDLVGNRKSRTTQPAGVTTNFSYDNIYQLKTAVQGSTTTESYTYDAVGNRLSSLGVSPYVYNTSNELKSKPSVSYTYDNNGNTLTKNDATGITTYAWDFENRLKSVTLPGSGGTVTFKYDPFGRRIYKSSTSGTSIYAYDGNSLVEETNSSGSIVARYSHGLNIDEPLAMLRSGTTSFYNTDGLGSVTSLSNSAGALAQIYGYDSFGQQTSSSGSLINPFQYTAREFDTETGLYFYRARHFDPKIGRFLSEDPIGFSGGTDFYVYVLNNPADYADPTGLKTQVCCRSLRFITGFLSGLNHCYVKISPDGGPAHTYGLHREGDNGVLFPNGAKPIKDDKTDKDGTCADVTNATPCSERAFAQGFDKIPNCQSCGKNYFGLTTNSNYWVSNTLGIFGMAAPAFNGGDASPGYQPRTPGGFGEK